MASRTPLGVIDLHDGLCPTENCEAWLGEHRFKIFQHHIITGWYLERYVNSFESLLCPGRDGKMWQQQHMLDEWVFQPARMSKVPNQHGWTEALAANWGWSAFLINRTSVKCFWIFQNLLILYDFVGSFSDFLLEFFVCFSESNWFLHVVSPFKMVLHVWKAIQLWGIRN